MVYPSSNTPLRTQSIVLPQSLTRDTQKHARSAKIWFIINKDVTALIQALARGEATLEHSTFTEHPNPSKVAFLRELCIEHGLLSPVHLDIERFQAWLAGKVALAHPDDGRMVTQYARWVHLNRMHHLAQIGQLKKGTFLSAKQSTTVAHEFLAFLRDRQTTPAACRQADIDDWLNGGPTTRSLARGFIRWAMKHGHLATIEIPYRLAKTTPVITQQQRLAHIQQLINSAPALRPLERTAALLLLLYGQPLANLIRLNVYTIDVDALFPHYGIIAGRLGAAGVAPTTTMLGVTRLAIPGQMVELEGTAVA